MFRFTTDQFSPRTAQPSANQESYCLDFVLSASLQTADDLQGVTGGSAATHSREGFEPSPILIPTLPEQTAIAEVLTEIDASLRRLLQRRRRPAFEAGHDAGTSHRTDAADMKPIYTIEKHKHISAAWALPLLREPAISVDFRFMLVGRFWRTGFTAQFTGHGSAVARRTGRTTCKNGVARSSRVPRNKRSHSRWHRCQVD